jgi:ABC-type lipoprotein export system ATPase subunit
MTVTLENICKRYQNPGNSQWQDVLKDISLEIHSGDALAISGPSGSGKSTLLNIIGTLDRPTSGRISFDGILSDSLSDNELAGFRNRHIGFVFQQHYLLPQLSLLENMLLPVIPVRDKFLRESALERATTLLGEVGLADKMYHLPGQLSGGECQRGAVVRAMINEPGLILADEPTGSLDSASAEQIGELLSEINKKNKVTLILVTHSDKLASMMNQVYRLSGGRLLKI